MQRDDIKDVLIFDKNENYDRKIKEVCKLHKHLSMPSQYLKNLFKQAGISIR